MAKNYTFDIAKIVTRKTDPARFFETFTIAPPKDLAGQFFGTLEIDQTNPLIANEITQLIINTLLREYTKEFDESNEVLSSFEIALRRVNEKLGSLTEQGQISWIGNLHTVITLVAQNIVHVSKAGDAEGYLIRHGRLSHITEGLGPSEKPHPLKTFSAITSGTLQLGDKIFLSTPDLFNFISLERLRTLISEYDPKEATASLIHVLQKEGAENINTILFEFTTHEFLSSKVITHHPEEFYLEEKTNWKQKFFSRARPALLKSQKTVKDYEERMRPTVIRAKKIIVKRSGNIFDKTFQKIKQGYLSIKYSKFIQNIRKKLSDNPLYEQISNLFEPKNKQRLLIALTILFISILFFSVSILFARKQSSNKYAATNTQLQEITKKQALSKNALIINDKVQARKILQEALTLAKNLLNDPYAKEQAQIAIAKIESQLLQIDNISEIKNPIPLADISTITEKSQGIIQSGKNVYIFSKDQGLIRIPIATKIAKKINKSYLGNFIGATITSDGLIIFLTDKPQVYEFDSKTSILTEVSTANQTWPKAVSISSFQTNIYLLDAVNGQVLKYAKTLDGYTQSSIIVSNDELKNAKALGIDGYIYVLTNSNKILKFLSGTNRSFAISEIPKPNNKLKNSIKIYTAEQATYLYAYDKGLSRIIEMTKTGEYSKQFTGDIFTNLSDFYISASQGLYYVLDAEKIYELKL